MFNQLTLAVNYHTAECIETKIKYTNLKATADVVLHMCMRCSMSQVHVI